MPFKPRNSRYWYASYYNANGKRIRTSTHTANYREAAALEGKWKADVWRQKQWGEQPRYSFQQLINGYLDDIEETASYERSVYAAKALAPSFAGAIVADITAEDIARYKKDRLQQVSVATLIKELGLLGAAINHANAEWDWKLPNVVAGRIPAQPEGRIRWITAEESARLIAQAEKRNGAPYLADMIRLALHTGLRHRELLQLTWDRIDWRHQLIYFDPDQQKARRTSSVPLNETALALLRKRWAERRAEYRTRRGKVIRVDMNYVFTFRGRSIKSAKKSFARAAVNADIDDLTIHDLRHTFASRLVQAGVPIATVKDVMRHRSIQTTLRYAHLAPENIHGAVDAIADYDQTQTEEGQIGLKTANI